MSGGFRVESGHMLIEKDGRTTFDTAHRAAELVPSAAIHLTDYSIAYPDLWKGTIYHQTRRTNEFFGIDYFGCSTWLGIVEQEWGPDRPSPNTLPDAVLGTVPAGTDYLEVWVNLQRTLDPVGLFVSESLKTYIAAGEWVELQGGSCLIEGTGPIRRLFEIRLDGTNAILRRRQSVTRDGPFVRSNGSAALGSAAFYYAGTNAPVDVTKYASYGALIQTLGEDSGDTHRPADKKGGSANNTPCSMSHAGKSYASTWTGSLIITPGRISA